jgi:hypothetical protein
MSFQQQQRKQTTVTTPNQVTTTTTKQVTRVAPTPNAPTAPTKRNVNHNNDIVSFTIKIPRMYYDLFSRFAQFLHSQPAQDPNTGQLLVDPKTGKNIPSIPAPDIQSYFVTCAMNTYQSYQMVMNMVKQRQAQQQPEQQ